MKKTAIISLALIAALPLLVPAATSGHLAEDNSPETRPVARRVSSVLFDLDKRAMPAGSDLEKLLPKRVGEFTRADFEPGAHMSGEDLSVTYRAGADTVLVGFSLPGTADDAQDGVRATRREAVVTGLDLKNELYSVGSEPSYFRLARFISWSRGGYFFYADAATPDAHGRFMRAFPY